VSARPCGAKRPAALAAAFANTVAAGDYAPAALTESPTILEEDGIAATMKHADSGEFEVNRFKGQVGRCRLTL
jgi:hypothetical protein